MTISRIVIYRRRRVEDHQYGSDLLEEKSWGPAAWKWPTEGGDLGTSSSIMIYRRRSVEDHQHGSNLQEEESWGTAEWKWSTWGGKLGTSSRTMISWSLGRGGELKNISMEVMYRRRRRVGDQQHDSDLQREERWGPGGRLKLDPLLFKYYFWRHFHFNMFWKAQSFKINGTLWLQMWLLFGICMAFSYSISLRMHF